MKITIEPTGEMAQLANAHQGSVWRGVTETGTPIVAIVVTLGCKPEDQRAFDRDFGQARPGGSEPEAANDEEGTPDAPRPQPA